jgi:hypothetical protein
MDSGGYVNVSGFVILQVIVRSVVEALQQVVELRGGAISRLCYNRIVS